MNTTTGIMVFCITVLCVVTSVCGYFGLGVTWTGGSSNLTEGQYERAEHDAIQQYYYETRGEAFLDNAFFDMPIDHNNDLFKQWVAVGKPHLTEMVQAEIMGNMKHPSGDIQDWAFNSGEFFFSMLSFDIAGVPYVFNLIWWVMSLYVLWAFVSLIRGVH